ncbi:hypothetical protein ACFRCW_24095 [Streptomyces sp. NPDC056653]|uniref:hypothetical protein n=1 Tax=Streptomyces sp. NPDC056653 TaxID=3345894 RepID=UPI0036B8E1BC
MDLPDPPGQLGVPAAPLAGFLLGLAPLVVGGGGEVQFPEGGLDTEVAAFTEERQYLRWVMSSPWAKKLRQP